MKGNKGFTLIELAVVLAIIAVLAAILTPLVSNYLEQARTARAMSEARTIADAVRFHHRDVGKYPIYTSMSATTTGSSGQALLAGPGAHLISFTGTGWVTTSFSLVTHLQTNAINAPTGASLGKVSWRGPYIGAIDSDPFGNAYLVTAAHLHSGSNFAFVLSAGPDGIVQTNYAQPNTTQFAAAGDDIIAIIK